MSTRDDDELIRAAFHRAYDSEQVSDQLLQAISSGAGADAAMGEVNPVRARVVAHRWGAMGLAAAGVAAITSLALLWPDFRGAGPAPAAPIPATVSVSELASDGVLTKDTAAPPTSTGAPAVPISSGEQPASEPALLPPQNPRLDAVREFERNEVLTEAEAAERTEQNRLFTDFWQVVSSHDGVLTELVEWQFRRAMIWFKGTVPEDVRQAAAPLEDAGIEVVFVPVEHSEKERMALAALLWDALHQADINLTMLAGDEVDDQGVGALVLSGWILSVDPEMQARALDIAAEVVPGIRVRIGPDTLGVIPKPAEPAAGESSVAGSDVAEISAPDESVAATTVPLLPVQNVRTRAIQKFLDSESLTDEQAQVRGVQVDLYMDLVMAAMGHDGYLVEMADWEHRSVEIWFDGNVPADVTAAAAPLEATGIAVVFGAAEYSDKDRHRMMVLLGETLRDNGIEATSIASDERATGFPLGAFVIAGPVLSVDPEMQSHALGIAAEILPGMEVRIGPYEDTVIDVRRTGGASTPTVVVPSTSPDAGPVSVQPTGSTSHG